MSADATIYDVAKAAGVAPSTVSRAFSRPGRVSSRTAAHIHEVAQRLGYRAAEPFRAPSRVHTQTVALVVADIDNPVFIGIVRGAERAAAAAGYSLMIGDTQESDAIEHELLGRLLGHVDGLVLATARASDTLIRSLARMVPLVVLNRNVTGLPCAMPDNPRGVRRAVEHLGELGHRRICYLAGPEASWTDGVRWRSLREAALELSLHDARLGPFPPTVAGGMAAAPEVVRRGHTAVLAYNDVMAIGLIRALTSSGWSVPDDVSVVGFDNIFAADLITPGLTTVAAPLAKLGETAVSAVVAIGSGGRPHASTPTVVPVRLVVRGSTGPPRPRSTAQRAGPGSPVHDD